MYFKALTKKEVLWEWTPGRQRGLWDGADEEQWENAWPIA